MIASGMWPIPRENFKKQPFYTYMPALSVHPIMQLVFSPTCEGSPGLQSLAYVQAGERPAACRCDEVTGPAHEYTPCHWRCERCHFGKIQVILVSKVSKGVAFWSWQHMLWCTWCVYMLFFFLVSVEYLRKSLHEILTDRMCLSVYKSANSFKFSTYCIQIIQMCS